MFQTASKVIESSLSFCDIIWWFSFFILFQSSKTPIDSSIYVMRVKLGLTNSQFVRDEWLQGWESGTYHIYSDMSKVIHLSQHRMLNAEYKASSGSKHEFHEKCHSVTSYFMEKDFKRCYDTSTPESIHTKDESKRGSAFAFIFGVNWPLQ